MSKPASPILMSACALLLLGLTGRLQAYSFPPPPPPPPAQPPGFLYKNPYFKLSATWNAPMYTITGIVADPNGVPGQTNTGSLTVMETWQLKPGASGGLEWVWQGDTGEYSIGYVQTAMPGYITWDVTTSSTYTVPNDAKLFTTYDQSSLSTVTSGRQTAVTANTTTDYANDVPVMKWGEARITMTTTSPTSVEVSATRTIYNGPLKQKEVITSDTTTTYAIGNQGQQLQTGLDSTYMDINTGVNANGSTAFTTTDNSTRKQTFAITVDRLGNQGSSLLTSNWDDNEVSAGYDQDGNQVSSASTDRARIVTNTVYKPGGTVVQVWPQSVTAVAQVSDHPQMGPPYVATLSRTTTWAAPPGGWPSSFNGSFTSNGSTVQLHIAWDDKQHITSLTDGSGVPTPDQAKQEYDTLYTDEASIMEMAPPMGEYPFYPNLVPNPFA